MSPNNRPSQYDWFKGSSNKNNPNHRKDQTKTVWKFTKIFLFFSLFFFTMWGCVQTFVVKTNPKVGQGLELYSDKEQISPKVISFDVTVDDAKKIYNINPTAKQPNIWVSKKDDEQTFNAIHDAFKAQGVTDLSEANKGTNTAFRVSRNGAEYASPLSATDPKIKTTKGILTFNNKPIVASTALNKDAFWKSHPAASAWAFNISSLNTYKKSGANIVVDKTISTIAPNTRVDDVSYARVYLNSEIARALLDVGGTGMKNFLTTAPTTDAEMTMHNKLVDQITYIMGQYKLVDKDHPNLGYVLNYANASNIYGYNNDDSYVSISTWGQAWEMGRGSGPFFGIFVYPLSWVTNKLIQAMPELSGWESLITIIVVVVAVSIIMFSLTFRGTLQQTKMQELSAKKAVIDAKYESYKGNRQMDMRKRQEIQELYKKEGISPLASMGSMFVTIPFFLAMWRTVGSIQHIKSTIWLGINFAATSWKELFSGEWQYLLLMAVTLGLQVFSALYTRILTKKRNANRMNLHQKEAMKKGNKTQNITIGITCFITVILSAGLQIYFIVRSLWRIFEIRLTHHILIKDKQKRIALGK